MDVEKVAEAFDTTAYMIQNVLDTDFIKKEIESLFVEKRKRVAELLSIGKTVVQVNKCLGVKDCTAYLSLEKTYAKHLDLILNEYKKKNTSKEAVKFLRKKGIKITCGKELTLRLKHVGINIDTMKNIEYIKISLFDNSFELDNIFYVDFSTFDEIKEYLKFPNIKYFAILNKMTRKV